MSEQITIFLAALSSRLVYTGMAPDLNNVAQRVRLALACQVYDVGVLSACVKILGNVHGFRISWKLDPQSQRACCLESNTHSTQIGASCEVYSG
jgi:hypothetical protein